MERERERYVCTKEDNSKLKEQSQTRRKSSIFTCVCVCVSIKTEPIVAWNMITD